MQPIIPIAVNDSTTGWLQRSRPAMLDYGNHPPSCYPIVGSDLEQRTLAPLQVNAMDSLISYVPPGCRIAEPTDVQADTAHALDDAYAVRAGPVAELHDPTNARFK